MLKSYLRYWRKCGQLVAGKYRVSYETGKRFILDGVSLRLNGTQYNILHRNFMKKDDEPAPISEKAWQMLTEAKIAAAMRDGEFSQLPGFGKPLRCIDEQVDAEMAELRAKRIAEEGTGS